MKTSFVAAAVAAGWVALMPMPRHQHQALFHARRGEQEACTPRLYDNLDNCDGCPDAYVVNEIPGWGGGGRIAS